MEAAPYPTNTPTNGRSFRSISLLYTSHLIKNTATHACTHSACYLVLAEQHLGAYLAHITDLYTLGVVGRHSVGGGAVKERRGQELGVGSWWGSVDWSGKLHSSPCHSNIHHLRFTLKKQHYRYDLIKYCI